MEEKDRYELICKEKFEEIISRQEEIIRILRGHNDNPGVMERVRFIEKVYKAVIGVVGFIVTVTIVQFIIWIREKFS